MINYPNIDPVLLEIGPIAIRWYALAYVAAILLGSYYADYLNNLNKTTKSKIYDNFIVMAIAGIILGGRLGYVIFYNFEYYIFNPMEALMIWQGGMSFHGGFLGVVLAGYIYCKKNNINIGAFADILSCAAPIGLFFGRIANFINGELYGRVTDVSWGMIFPSAGDMPRHPSQLYEAMLEGMLLFILLFVLFRFTGVRKVNGVLTGIFISGYAICRIIVENYREPDQHIGFLFDQVTTGQLLSYPMLAVGIIVILFAIGRINVNK
jgi:phosphatidylglycerol:prolipoprotein diacylglycerol transferase